MDLERLDKKPSSKGEEIKLEFVPKSTSFHLCLEELLINMLKNSPLQGKYTSYYNENILVKTKNAWYECEAVVFLYRI